MDNSHLSQDVSVHFLPGWYDLPDGFEPPGFSDDNAGGLPSRGMSQQLPEQQPQQPEQLHEQHCGRQQVPATPTSQLPMRIMAETKGAWRTEKEALARLPKLDNVPIDYSVVDKFLLEVEAFGSRFADEDEWLDIAESRMDTQVIYFYSRRMKALLPGKEKNYKTLAELMTKLVFSKDAESLLHKNLEAIPKGELEALDLYNRVGVAYDAYVRYCERTNAPIKVTEESLASKYTSLLRPHVANETSGLAESYGNPDIFRCVEIAVAVDEPYPRSPHLISITRR